MASGTSSIYPRFPEYFIGDKTSSGGNIYYVLSTASTAADAADHGTYPAPPTISPGVGAAQSAGPGPFATVNFAVTRCAANQGDRIVVLPGHVEPVASAAALAIGVAGIMIIFCGNEADRAQVNFKTLTSATATVTAANVTIKGMRVLNSIDARVDGFIVSAADCHFVDCEFVDANGASSLISVRTTAAGTRLRMDNPRFVRGDELGTQKTEFLRLVGGDGHVVRNPQVTGSFSTAIVNNITTLASNIVLDNNLLNNTHATGVAVAALSTTTGFVNGGMLVAVAAPSYVAAGLNFGPTVATGISAGAGSAQMAETSVSKSTATAVISSKTLFTIAGGPIEVLELCGLITTTIGAVANATKLTWTPTVGGTATDITVGVDINAAAAGDLYVLATSFGTAAVLVTTGIETAAQHTASELVRFICAPGVITMANAGNSVTGVIQWCLRYRPLSPFCTVS